MEVSGIWADTETTVDLLGFDYLVDALVLMLTEPRLIPVTVGVNGDWGSGKSSLMLMARERLERMDGDYACIEFSPWMHEDYEDVKLALMSAVLSELRDRIPEEEAEIYSQLQRILQSLHTRIRSVKTLLPQFLGGLAPQLLGMDPTDAALLGQGLGVAAAATASAEEEEEPAADDLTGPEVSTGLEDEADLMTLAGEFRQLFEELVARIDVAGVVVFIDDVDRCLPPAVVDTFEAIRLFLDVPKTAYVVAAHRTIVEAAIDNRYQDVNERYRTVEENTVGHDYLEKMLQIVLDVPPLSEPEVESYLTLLLCELHLDQEAFEQVKAEATSGGVRLSQEMNHGRVVDLLGSEAIPEELDTDLAWVVNVAPAIARGLRGNPRQTKRFLNRLRLRVALGERRDTTLDHAILAKIMVLDELNPGGFDQLLEWEVQQGGACSQLRQAEVSFDPEADVSLDDEVEDWLSEPSVADWLTLEPPLADRDLRPYVYLARERTLAGRAASRLPPQLQELLQKLGDRTQTTRRQAVREAEALEEPDLRKLFEALLDHVIRQPRSPAMRSSLEVASGNDDLIENLKEALRHIPVSTIPLYLPGQIVVRLRQSLATFDPILDLWMQEGSGELAQAVREARSHSKRDQ